MLFRSRGGGQWVAPEYPVKPWSPNARPYFLETPDGRVVPSLVHPTHVSRLDAGSYYFDRFTGPLLVHAPSGRADAADRDLVDNIRGFLASVRMYGRAPVAPPGFSQTPL